MTSNKKIVNVLCLTVCVALSACSISNNKNQLKLKSGDYELQVNFQNLKMQFSEKNTGVIVPADTASGIYINESPVVKAELERKSETELILYGTTANGEKTKVNVTFHNGVSKITVAPTIENSIVSVHLGGMPIAHGLGDAGGWNSSFNLVGKEPKIFPIVNDGGRRRWVSTFIIFPQNKFAGVFFNRGRKSVVLSEDTYQLKTEIEGESTFYFFIGETKEIYANYKKVRNELGYEDIKPKSRMFELGWESWDALGWNTNQETVKHVLSKFLALDYPIRWAVTGSGFWRSKSHIYDAGMKTPLLVSWPAKIDEKQKGNQLISTIDLAPTFIEIAGLNADDYTLQGRSLLPVFLNSDSQNINKYIFSEQNWHGYSSCYRSVRDTEGFVYIWNGHPDRSGIGGKGFVDYMMKLNDAGELSDLQKDGFRFPRDEEELYHYQSDVHQTINLATNPEYTAKLKELRKVFEKWQKLTGDKISENEVPDWYQRPYSEEKPKKGVWGDPPGTRNFGVGKENRLLKLTKAKTKY